MRPAAFLSLLVALALTLSSSAGAAGERAATPSPNVVGGTDAAPGSWPFAAYVLADFSDGAHACTGSVVGPGAILTAAHCVVDQDSGAVVAPDAVMAVTGRRDLGDASSGTIHDVLAVHVHPGYDVESRRDDAALLALATASPAPSIALVAPADDALTGAGTAAAFAGWGTTSGSGTQTPSMLQTATTTLQSDTTCRRRLTGFDAATMLCATDTRTTSSVCRGDSGGPLVVASADGSWVQAGITSWGSSTCSPRQPQAFARVSAISDWVARLLPSLTPPPPAVPDPVVPDPSTGDDGADAPDGADGPDADLGTDDADGDDGLPDDDAIDDGVLDDDAPAADDRGRPTARAPLAALAGARLHGTTAQHRAIVLRVARDGSAIGALDLRYRLRCGSESTRVARLRVTNLAARVDARGAFSARRTSGTARLRLSGRLTAPRRVAGTLRVVARRAGCDTGAVRYSVRR
ncbi:trypsin-like serine protease [Conexibacter sp. CPCC 206217]|uniref:S1 family peptidase n=1 Tax=Conexibacter sp. CPCC 206217 TaxID=3064574 RepID=UPI0027168C57|nr:serine protease [Conexibacter sp. CPCC 206217]MDO8210905.1 serine protease [Conexibacter sp. CPCC 206217]